MPTPARWRSAESGRVRRQAVVAGQPGQHPVQRLPGLRSGPGLRDGPRHRQCLPAGLRLLRRGGGLRRRRSDVPRRRLPARDEPLRRRQPGDGRRPVRAAGCGGAALRRLTRPVRQRCARSRRGVRRRQQGRGRLLLALLSLRGGRHRVRRRDGVQRRRDLRRRGQLPARRGPGVRRRHGLRDLGCVRRGARLRVRSGARGRLQHRVRQGVAGGQRDQEGLREAGPEARQRPAARPARLRRSDGRGRDRLHGLLLPCRQRRLRRRPAARPPRSALRAEALLAGPAASRLPVHRSQLRDRRHRHRQAQGWSGRPVADLRDRPQQREQGAARAAGRDQSRQSGHRQGARPLLRRSARADPARRRRRLLRGEPRQRAALGADQLQGEELTDQACTAG